jgi:integrase
MYDIQLYLRKFHVFLAEEKGLDVPYEFVLSLPIVREKKIFNPLSQDEIKSILNKVDRDTDLGKRDYAIILLAARSGLRGSDVINLKLNDIDWRAGKITLTQKKTTVELVLPLLDDVADALKIYIVEARPNTNLQNVFLRAVHPYRPLTNTASLNHMIKKYQNIAGIERYAHDGKGFHSLRRSLGQALTENEVPVTTTAQILGHSSVESTKPYISLNTEQLKKCALSFDEIKFSEGGVYYGSVH